MGVTFHTPLFLRASDLGVLPSLADLSISLFYMQSFNDWPVLDVLLPNITRLVMWRVHTFILVRLPVLAFLGDPRRTDHGEYNAGYSWGGRDGSHSPRPSFGLDLAGKWVASSSSYLEGFFAFTAVFSAHAQPGKLSSSRNEPYVHQWILLDRGPQSPVAVHARQSLGVQTGGSQPGCR